MHCEPDLTLLFSCDSVLVARQSNFPNIFYVLVVVFGAIFLLTAFSYTVVVVQEARNGYPSPDPLSQFLGQHGGKLFLGEILLLALVSLAAMAWEQPRDGR